MGLLHTPRTIVAISRGLIKRRQQQQRESGRKTWIGFGATPGIYRSRLGLWDVDYLGHMNNAAYLTHAELARWELTAQNGMLSAMYHHNVNYLVVGTVIRYRKEIRPLWCQFQIDTSLCGMDSRNMYILHQFRLPSVDGVGPPSRILAQMIAQGVAVQGKDVIDPAMFLKDKVGVDASIVNDLCLPKNIHESAGMEELLERYVALDDAMKKTAAVDDAKLAMSK